MMYKFNVVNHNINIDFLSFIQVMHWTKDCASRLNHPHSGQAIVSRHYKSEVMICHSLKILNTYVNKGSVHTLQLSAFICNYATIAKGEGAITKQV